MIVGAAGDDPKACILQLSSKNLSILDDLGLILFELGLKRFIEAGCLCSDGMHERTALSTRENTLVDSLGIFFLAEDEAAAGAAKGLMSGAGYNICVFYGVHMKTGCNKAGDMSHIYHEDSADFMCDISDDIEANSSGICACTGNDELRLAFICNAAELIIIYLLILLAYAVRNDIEILTAHIDGAAVGKMTAVAEVHAENCITGVEQRKVYGQVCLCAGMRLNICMLCTEELLNAFTSEVLNLINAFASAVVALSGITFCILVCKVAAHSCHNSLTHKVLRSNKLEVAALAGKLLFHIAAKFGVMSTNYIKLNHNYLHKVIVIP